MRKSMVMVASVAMLAFALVATTDASQDCYDCQFNARGVADCGDGTRIETFMAFCRYFSPTGGIGSEDCRTQWQPTVCPSNGQTVWIPVGCDIGGRCENLSIPPYFAPGPSTPRVSLRDGGVVISSKEALEEFDRRCTLDGDGAVTCRALSTEEEEASMIGRLRSSPVPAPRVPTPTPKWRCWTMSDGRQICEQI